MTKTAQHYQDNDPKAPRSPWGKVQEVTTLGRGVRWVSTAGHGGLMVSKGCAKTLLSPNAIHLAGDEWNGYICFEEDCACILPLLERPEWLRELFPNTTSKALSEVAQRHYPTYSSVPIF